MPLGCGAWLVLIQPATHMVAMDIIDTCAVGDMAPDSRNDAAHWESVIANYSDVIEPPKCLLIATLFTTLNLNLDRYHCLN